jgi:hypothetical protein
MRFGDVPIADRHYHEVYVQTSINSVLVGGGVDNIRAMGSFVMPFAGRAVVSFWASLTWTGNQANALSMSSTSTPPPSDSSDILIEQATSHPSFPSSIDLASHCVWNNLTAGQTVTMRGRVWCGGGVGPTWSWALAFVRMHRP